VNATGSSARFDDPRGVTVGPDGNVYVADTYNDCIRKITPDGVVTTLAGTNSSGYVDGASTLARFYRPWAVAAGPDGYLYVADRYNYRIRRVSPTGQVTTVAGTGSSARSDGAGNASGHQDDLGIAVSRSGDLYVAEAECVRVIERIVDIGDVVAGG
jgi:streptogramin lyase